MTNASFHKRVIRFFLQRERERISIYCLTDCTLYKIANMSGHIKTNTIV